MKAKLLILGFCFSLISPLYLLSLTKKDQAQKKIQTCTSETDARYSMNPFLITF
jgi:hypothetical protein